ncbi:helix-turn-helix domain-containing protein [Psychrobacter sp. M9-54-1]|uniref:XRE family transcriptional regulator n=1 Tax=Psychrobacter sp. M9-54-1 TaxID=2782386 RepID=UPI00190A23A7|nr:LexA family transcriptional regulator [Psychrobacter sp. M9-54-1]MBK3394652.1 helix-turn-helix domain-containing protein [Psychrobacter sp. M9-54-1]
MSMDLDKVAERIKDLMDSKGLKQVDVVKAIGISKSSVSKWLNAKACPSGKYLRRLSEVLETSEYWILNGEYPYSSYEDIDDAMDYMNAYEESMRDHYIAELGLEPDLPYSIRFLQEEFETKMFSEYEKIEQQYQLSAEQEREIEEYEEWLEWGERADDFIENRLILEQIKKYSNLSMFIEDFKYVEETLRLQSEIARRTNTNLNKTLFYNQEDSSMDPLISVGAQCSVDLTKRTIKNGKFYLIRSNSFYGVRALFRQSDGGLLLQCKNKEYPDEKISKSKIDSLEVLGYVYAWTNMDPW